jgi:hypothetical protein
MRALLAILFAALLAFPAAARPLSPAEADALGKSVERYLSAIGRADAPAIVEALPPRILYVFAGATGVEAGKLEKTLVEQTKALMKGTKFRDLGANRSALDVQEAQLAGGGQVLWTLVPTTFTTEAKGKRTRHDQPLLALREKETWYFLRIDGPQQRQLAALAYPFLSDVEFPAASTAPAQ